MGRSRLPVAMFVALAACGGDEKREAPDIGRACDVPQDCFDDLEERVPGVILCIDRIAGGFCTHSCGADGDCCVVPGECDFGAHGRLAEVCAPFEPLEDRWCFISCSDRVVGESGAQTADAFCASLSADLACITSGEGALTRRICAPGTTGDAG